MMKLVVSTFLTLDGVMQAPGGAEEDTDGGFKYGGWQGPYFDEDAGKWMNETLDATDGWIMGRKTYQIHAGYWPTAPAEDPFAKKLNSIPKYVVSNTLKSVEWMNSTLVRGDIPQEVSRIKQSGSGLLVTSGSSQLSQALIANHLVDEYNLWVHPLILGSGKRLYPQGIEPIHLKLVDQKATSTGILILTYRPE